uniref:Uncharacterized protein n=1 Tax=Xiphophorus couchianus TaxID=32473 RepID=A0A3B5LJ46_9TELE
MSTINVMLRHFQAGESNLQLGDAIVFMPLCVLWFSGVIAVVIFIVACAAAILARFICIRKETYRNQEVKAAQSSDGRAFPFSGQPDSLSVQSENQKEFFI